MATTTRAYDALTLEEERHMILAKAHLALAAKCRLNSVKETRFEILGAKTNFKVKQESLFFNLHGASKEVLADKNTMLLVLPAICGALELCSPEWLSDPELVLAACQDDGFIFEKASPELQADRDLVLQAVKIDGWALKFASLDLKGDKEIVLAAMQSQPLSLRYATDEFRYDPGLVLDALRLQTRRNALVYNRNVLSYVLGTDISEKELVLEAARAAGEILTAASLELRQNKDFILEAMRRAPSEDQQKCYAAADESVRSSLSFEDFQGACNSVLARAGDDAPVLTIVLASDRASSTDQHGSLEPTSCEVLLLSGASFTCRFPDPEADPVCEPTEPTAEAPEDRASKRRRTDPPLFSMNLTLDLPGDVRVMMDGDGRFTINRGGQVTVSGDRQDTVSSSSETSLKTGPLTVGRLAELVKRELPAHTEAIQPPPHVFIVFAKRGAEGQDPSIPMTPWDWNRPLTDFC